MNEYKKLDIVLDYLNEGIVVDWIKNSARKEQHDGAIKLIEGAIKKKDYRMARNALEDNKKYLSDEEYEKYKKQIDAITPKDSPKYADMNDIEKKYIDGAYSLLNTTWKSLISSSKYKKLNSYLEFNKEDNRIYNIKSNAYDKELHIASVGFEDEDIDYDSNEDIFKLRDDLVDTMWKKVKTKYSKVDYDNDYAEGRVCIFYVNRKDIPGNK